MFDYIIGTIKKINSNSIVIDNNGIGYKVFTPNPYIFVEDEEVKVYLYNHIREDENSLYGFKTDETRDLFLKLIDVKGLGPKMALPMLASGSVESIVNAIDKENIDFLKKFPKIGEKVARQIILDLKGKLVSVDNVQNTELSLVLESLGYKSVDIKRVIQLVDMNLPIEQQVKDALKLLLK